MIATAFTLGAICGVLAVCLSLAVIDWVFRRGVRDRDSAAVR